MSKPSITIKTWTTTSHARVEISSDVSHGHRWQVREASMLERAEYEGYNLSAERSRFIGSHFTIVWDVIDPSVDPVPVTESSDCEIVKRAIDTSRNPWMVAYEVTTSDGRSCIWECGCKHGSRSDAMACTALKPLHIIGFQVSDIASVKPLALVYQSRGSVDLCRNLREAMRQVSRYETKKARPTIKMATRRRYSGDWEHRVEMRAFRRGEL